MLGLLCNRLTVCYQLKLGALALLTISRNWINSKLNRVSEVNLHLCVGMHGQKRQTTFSSLSFEGRDLWGGIKLRQDIGKSKQESMSVWTRVTVCITLKTCSADSIADIKYCSLVPYDVSQYSVSINLDYIKGLVSPITGTNWAVAH